METRTSRETVTFSHDFVLAAMAEVLPPGDYEFETVEKPLEGRSFQTFIHVSTKMILPSTPGHSGLERVLSIDPEDLAAAIRRDTGGV